MPPAETAQGRERSSRATPRLLVLAALILLALRVGVGIYESVHPPKGFDRVPWIDAADFDPATAHGKPILYDFSAEWCGPCQQMRHELFGDRKQAESIGEWFTPVRVVDRNREDGHNSPAVATLQARYAVDAFPTLVVVFTNGRPPERQVGYPGKRETTAFLQSAHYRAILPQDSTRMHALATPLDSAAADSQPPQRHRPRRLH